MGEKVQNRPGWVQLPTWWPIIIVVITSACSGAAAWGASQAHSTYQDARIDQIDHRLEVIDRIDRRLSNIEGRLGISSGGG